MSIGLIECYYPRLDALVASGSALQVVADTSAHEGPHWLESATWEARSRSLLFSDVEANAIWRWDP